MLVGGSPVRVLRLTPAGARQVAAWFAGAPVPDRPGARALARRLLDAGIAHPDFARRRRPACRPPGAGRRHGRDPGPGPARELGRCLPSGPAADAASPHVIVVDDASADPAAIARIAAARGAARHSPAGERRPGRARATPGWPRRGPSSSRSSTPTACPRPGWLDGLLPHFADPAVGAVAPRIVPHEAGSGWLARYEGASSTLDMGARPSHRPPRCPASPTCPARRSWCAGRAAGDGFAEGMYVGEDVDFVWRLAAAGWRVRYEPAAVMGHDHRVRFRAWFARRADYGTSAAALEQLHPGAVRPLYASWWTAGAWAAALSGRPGAAAALTARRDRLARPPPVPGHRRALARCPRLPGSIVRSP